jgi:hypothetical protein
VRNSSYSPDKRTSIDENRFNDIKTKEIELEEREKRIIGLEI